MSSRKYHGQRGCPLCRGQGTIECSLYENDISYATYNSPYSLAPVRTKKQYPCPECKTFTVVEETAMMYVQNDLDRIKHYLASKMADRLLECGMIEFDVPDTRHVMYSIGHDVAVTGTLKMYAGVDKKKLMDQVVEIITSIVDDQECGSIDPTTGARVFDEEEVRGICDLLVEKFLDEKDDDQCWQ